MQHIFHVRHVKVNFAQEQPVKSKRGSRGNSSTFSLTLALDKGGCVTSRPYLLPPGKETRYPFYRRLRGSQAGLDGCGKSSPSLQRDLIPVPSSQ